MDKVNVNAYASITSNRIIKLREYINDYERLRFNGVDIGAPLTNDDAIMLASECLRLASDLVNFRWEDSEILERADNDIDNAKKEIGMWFRDRS